MFKRLSSREAFFFVVTLILALTYGGLNWVVKPMQAQIKKVDQQITTEQKKLKSNLKIIRKSALLDGQYKAYQQRFKQQYTNEQVMSSILSEIEEVAGELSLQISNLKPKKVREEDLYNQFSVSLTMNSEFNKIMQFVYRLQSEPHLFDVEEVRFEKGPRKKNNTVKTSLVLNRVLIPN